MTVAQVASYRPSFDSQALDLAGAIPPMKIVNELLCLPGVFFLITRFGGTALKQRALDAYHASGRWAALRNIPYPEMVALVARYARGGRILDCGCGTGATAAALPPDGFERYDGVELSPSAVAYAKARGLAKAEFYCGDVETFQPAGNYDVILFQEALYYLSAAVRRSTLRRYAATLKPKGVVIITVVDPRRFAAMLDSVRRDYRVVEDSSFHNSRRVFLVVSPCS